MKMEIEKKIQEIQNLFDNEQHQRALSLCDEFINDHPNAWVGYRNKADMLLKLKNYEASLEAREKLAEMSSSEPADYYDLARSSLALGENAKCLKWAGTGIDLCKKYDNFYYYKACHFYKACALVNLKRFDEALQDCEMLDSDYGAYIPGIGMKTKEDLVKSAKHALKSKQ